MNKMKEIEFETLHSNKHRIYLLCGIVCVVVLMVTLIITASKAKYRVTESVPLIQGTINYSASDLNLMAVYLNKNGETLSSDKVPHVGYTLNTDQSMCEVNDVKDETIEIVYENGLLNFNGLGNKGTKCTAYFDLIPDSENPMINGISSGGDDTSLYITIDATDNIGVYYYYYKLDNGEEFRSEENDFTFEGLEKDSVHTVTVRVEDAAGNISEVRSKEVTVGVKGGDFILASVNAPTSHMLDWTGKESYYYTGNSNNWVQFGGFWWRIIRINGDGTVRMIYQGTSANTTGTGTQTRTVAFNSSTNNNRYVGFKHTVNQVHGIGTNSTILNALNSWYAGNLIDEAEYLDGNAGFCGDRIPSTSSSSSNGSGGTGTTTTYYGAYIRLVSNNSPSLQCDSQDVYTTTDSSSGNKSLQYSIGLVTADEAALAGITWNNGSKVSYLYTGQTYWTMSPSSFFSYSEDSGAETVAVSHLGILTEASVSSTIIGVRPVINLRSDVQITGTGTVDDPFKVVGA